MAADAMPSLNQPRRKTSSSSNAPALGRRQSSWDLLENDQDQTSLAEDAMDTDEFSTGQLFPAHPIRELAERIGKEVEIFAEELDKYVTKSKKSQKILHKELVSLVKSYRVCADDTTKRLRNKYNDGFLDRVKPTLNRKSHQGQSDHDMDADYQTGIDDLARWQREAHTWSLFQCMLESDYPDLKFNNSNSLHKSNDRFAADGDTWRLFLDENDTARERLKVLRWLESSAEVTGDDVGMMEYTLAQSSGRGSGFLDDGWMDTRERIKSQKRLRIWNDQAAPGLPHIQTSDGRRQLVTQLDLDSIFRQDRSLETPDEHFERAFWQLCWEMLRRGYSMDAIQNWCAERNELARAFSIGAHAVSSSGHSIYTPNSRFLWRQTCAVASRNSRMAYERAVFGFLSGQMEASNPPCLGWTDHLFVLYNNRLLQQYVSFLKEKSMLDLSKPALIAYPVLMDGISAENRKYSAKSLVDSLASDPSSKVDPLTAFEPVQSALVSHSLVELIRSQGVALARDRLDLIEDLIQDIPANYLPADQHIDFIADDPDTLRTLTHMYLVLRELGVDFGTGNDLLAAENVLCGYLRFLLFAGKMHVIPVYASQLSKSTCLDVLARVLPVIIEPQEQRDFVALMEASGIDVPEVLTHHNKLTMQYCPSISKPGNSRPAAVDLTAPTTESYWPEFRINPRRDITVGRSELTVIRSLAWFFYIEGGWARTFEALTEVVIGFLRSGAFELVGVVYNKLSFSDVSKLKTPDYMIPPYDITDESEDDNDPSDSDNDVRMLSDQLSPQRDDRVSRSFGEPMRLETPENSKVRRDLYKAHAATYHELGQLSAAIEALLNWSDREYEAVALTQRKNASEALAKVRKDCKKTIDALVSAMEPLLHETLVKPSPSASAEELKEIRQMYLPQMVLAYASALQCAAFFISKDHLLQSLDLSTNIADNKVLIEDIKSQGLMGTVVDTFARASKCLLHLKEVGANKSKKKERPGSAIWDV